MNANSYLESSTSAILKKAEHKSITVKYLWEVCLIAECEVGGLLPGSLLIHSLPLSHARAFISFCQPFAQVWGVAWTEVFLRALLHLLILKWITLLLSVVLLQLLMDTGISL